MTYKEAITKCVDEYASDARSMFIGYNTAKGSRMYGTLANVPTGRCVEMPVCENLMMGMAIGLALEGMMPVVCFERHDFLLLALDALVNHVDKMPWISGDQFKLPIIIRAIVGASKPLNPGVQHTQDYTTELRKMLKHTPVLEPLSYRGFKSSWDGVGHSESGAVVIVEHRDWYDWSDEECKLNYKIFEEMATIR